MLDKNIVISRARQLLKDFGICQAPIDVDALALYLGFHVSRKELPDGEAGSTFERRGKKHILINEKDGLNRQRFTILHELAHHILQLPSQHGEKVHSDELEQFKGRPKEEALCDLFAAECLVPWQIIQPLAVQDNFTLEGLTTLSDHFQASRSCVASRFAQASQDLLAYVVAEGGIIQYSRISKKLRESKICIKRKVPLPQASAACKAIQSGTNEFDVFSSELDGNDWSNSDGAQRFVCFEEATYYAPTEQTQSFLVFEEVEVNSISNHHQKLDYDDELLEELSGYPGWSKPR